MIKNKYSFFVSYLSMRYRIIFGFTFSFPLVVKEVTLIGSIFEKFMIEISKFSAVMVN